MSTAGRKALRTCPSEFPIAFPTWWYTCSYSPDFRVCSKCYEESLASSPFAKQFAARFEGSGRELVCNFNTPRVRAVMYACLTSRRFDPFVAYAQCRCAIQPCKQSKEVPPSDGFLWYPLAGRSELSGFVACQACFEDYVLAFDGLNACFAREPILQPDGANVICDVSKFVKRVIQRGIQPQAFAALAEKRMRMLACPGSQSVEFNARKWYAPRVQGLSNTFVCEVCYHDEVAWTGMEHFFQECSTSLRTDETVVCSLGSSVPLHAAWQETVKENNFNLWRHAAEVAAQSPACVPTGMTSTSWFTLNPHCEDFDVCKACYAGIVETFALQPYFLTKAVVPGVIRVCDFNIASPRGPKYIMKLNEAYETTNMSMFVNYVRRMGSIPVCPRSVTVQGRLWYGTGSWFACQECFCEAMEGSPLVRQLTFQKASFGIDRAIKCDLYSPLVRGRWQAANAAGVLDSFNAWMQERDKIWQLLRTEKLKVEELESLRILQQASLFGHGITREAADFAGGCFSSDRTRYGNDSMGYHWHSRAGVEGHQMVQEALSTLGFNPAVFARLSELELIWQNFE